MICIRGRWYGKTCDRLLAKIPWLCCAFPRNSQPARSCHCIRDRCLLRLCRWNNLLPTCLWLELWCVCWCLCWPIWLGVAGCVFVNQTPRLRFDCRLCCQPIRAVQRWFLWFAKISGPFAVCCHWCSEGSLNPGLSNQHRLCSLNCGLLDARCVRLRLILSCCYPTPPMWPSAGKYRVLQNGIN